MLLPEKSPSIKCLIKHKDSPKNELDNDNSSRANSILEKGSLIKGSLIKSLFRQNKEKKDEIKKIPDFEEIIMIEKEEEHVKNFIKYLKSKSTKGSKLYSVKHGIDSEEDFIIENEENSYPSSKQKTFNRLKGHKQATGSDRAKDIKSKTHEKFISINNKFLKNNINTSPRIFNVYNSSLKSDAQCENYQKAFTNKFLRSEKFIPNKTNNFKKLKRNEMSKSVKQTNFHNYEFNSNDEAVINISDQEKHTNKVAINKKQDSIPLLEYKYNEQKSDNLNKKSRIILSSKELLNLRKNDFKESSIYRNITNPYFNQEDYNLKNKVNKIIKKFPSHPNNTEIVDKISKYSQNFFSIKNNKDVNKQILEDNNQHTNETNHHLIQNINCNIDNNNSNNNENQVNYCEKNYFSSSPFLTDHDNKLAEDNILHVDDEFFFERQNSKNLITKKPIDTRNSVNIEQSINQNKRNLIKNIDKVFDSLTEEESYHMENIFVINLGSKLNFFIDLMVFIIVFFTTIFLPLKLVGLLSVNVFTFLLEMTFDAVFLVDFCSGFFLAYYDSEENYIKNLNKTLENYLKENFFIDLLSAFPINSFYEFLFFHKNYTEEIIGNMPISKLNTLNIGNNYVYASYNSMLLNDWHFSDLLMENLGTPTKLFQLLRLLRILKIKKFFQQKNRVIVKINGLLNSDNSLFLLLKHFISMYCIFLLISHCLTCAFIFFASFESKNWISGSRQENKAFEELYLSSLYFTHTTIFSIGYGDIISINKLEKIYNIILMIIGVFLYSFALTALTNIVKQRYQISKSFYDKKACLDNISKEYKISYSLYQKIYRHLYFANLNNKNASKILINELPIALRNELIFNMYKNLINICPFFMDLYDKEFILKILMFLKPTTSKHSEALIQQGDFVDEVIFIKSGLLQLDTVVDIQINFKKRNTARYKVNHLKTFKSFKSLKENMYSNLLTNDLKDKSPVKSNKDTDISYGVNLKEEKNKPRISNFSLDLNNFPSIFENKDSQKTFENYLNNNNNISNNISNNNNRNEGILKSVLTANTTRTNFDLNKSFIFKLKIAKMKSNEYFGDTLIIENKRSIFTLKTKSKTTELFLMDKFDLLKLLREFPGIFSKIYHKSNKNMGKYSDIVKIATKVAKKKIEKDFKNKSIYFVDFENLKNNIISTHQIYNYLLVNEMSDLNFDNFLDTSSANEDSSIEMKEIKFNFNTEEPWQPADKNNRIDTNESITPDAPRLKYFFDSIQKQPSAFDENKLIENKHISHRSRLSEIKELSHIIMNENKSQISYNLSKHSNGRDSNNSQEMNQYNIDSLSMRLIGSGKNTYSKKVLKSSRRKEANKAQVHNNFLKVSSAMKINSKPNSFSDRNGDKTHDLNQSIINNNSSYISYLSSFDHSSENCKLDEFPAKEKLLDLKKNIPKKILTNSNFLGKQILSRHSNTFLNSDKCYGTNNNARKTADKQLTPLNIVNDSHKKALKPNIQGDQQDDNLENYLNINKNNQSERNLNPKFYNFHHICEFCKQYNKNIVTLSKENYKVYENKIETVNNLSIQSTTAESSSDDSQDYDSNKTKNNLNKQAGFKASKLCIRKEANFSIVTHKQYTQQASSEDFFAKENFNNLRKIVSASNKFNLKLKMNVFNQITNDSPSNILGMRKKDSTSINAFKNYANNNNKQENSYENTYLNSSFEKENNEMKDKSIKPDSHHYGEERNNVNSFEKANEVANVQYKYPACIVINYNENVSNFNNKDPKENEKPTENIEDNVIKTPKTKNRLSLGLNDPFINIKRRSVVKKSISENKLSLNYNPNEKLNSFKFRKSQRNYDGNILEESKTESIYNEIFGLHEDNIGNFFEKIIKQKESKNLFQKQKESLNKLDKILEYVKTVLTK